MKTGTDAQAGLVATAPISSTIASLSSLSAPPSLPQSERIPPVELTTYVLDGTLTSYSFEDDSDYHLVVADGAGNTMIVEIPHPSCVGNTSPFLQQITSARSTFDAAFRATSDVKATSTPIRVTGVGFWDDLHGQRGVALNGIELHPVLGLQFNPSGPPSGVITAVEYYYAAWNFYFVTSLASEIAALDGGAFGGVWKRTGQTFNVWSDSTGGALATHRFFSTGFSPKSSHFYTPYVNEYNGLRAGTAWEYEGIAFYVLLPDANGKCAAGTVILYRLYNNGMGGAPNHRFTISVVTFNAMKAAGWLFEGNGLTGAYACVPQ